MSKNKPERRLANIIMNLDCHDGMWCFGFDCAHYGEADILTTMGRRTEEQLTDLSCWRAGGRGDA